MKRLGRWLIGLAALAVALSVAFAIAVFAWARTHGLYGVEAASFGYSVKPAEALTLPQAAALVVPTRGPGHYSPWCHPDRLAQRIAALQQDPALALEDLLPPAPGACTG